MVNMMEIPTKCETCNRVLESDLGKDGSCYVELCPDCTAEERKKGYEEGVRDHADSRVLYVQDYVGRTP